MTLIQTEPKSIKIGIPHDDYSAMQGPCPDGFHVPTKDEWVDLCGILTTTFSMASNATTMGTYLKLPMAGYRNYSDATVYYVGSTGRYWSSTQYNANNAYDFTFSSYVFYPQDDYYRSYGFSVRCFKNSPTIPTSTWTTLYQGAGSAGIFWNSTDGLISVSGDGQTWYTIQDKNLGATTVYNNGDTMSEANCGKYYQRGNNYGFPFTGSVTTSSTQVDASAYGPGNYYSSSTFIIGNSDRSSVQNDNLRGGVTGMVQKADTDIKKVYLGSTQVRPELIPITTPGIYHNATLGLISLSSDGESWLTISDKNLGATQVYNSGDTLSEANCGKYYQRGNNYGFPRTGSVTTSTAQVNAQNYGPGNYYNSGTFIIRQTTPYNWDSSTNANLRGGTTGTNEAMRGPCSSGFHIPTKDEWISIKNIWATLGGGSSDGTNFGIALKIPFAGYRSYYNSNSFSGEYGHYWSSVKAASNDYAYRLYFYSSNLNAQSTDIISQGASIRQFANTPTQPDSSWKQVYPKVIKETFTFTPGDSTFKSLAKSGYKINQIVMESTIRFTGSAQIYMNICPTNSTSSQDIVKVAFSTIGWNGRHIETGRDGASWTTHQSGGSISTNTDYPVKVTIGRDSGIMEFNGTPTTLTYSTTEKNVIASVFNSATPYGQTPTYDSNVASRTITYTVTYQ